MIRAIFLLLAISFTAGAAEYELDVSLASIYTSNLTLAPDDMAESQWVNAVSPRFFLTKNTPRYQIDLDYELQAFFYANESELNEAFSRLWTVGLLDLWSDRLFLRGLARATQVNVNPEGLLQGNNVSVTGNRSDVLAWDAGPLFRGPVFRRSEIDAHFYAGRITYSDDELQSVDTQEGQLRLWSDQLDIKRFTYDVEYTYRKLDYERTGPFKSQRGQLELGYFATTTLQLVGIGGVESNLVTNDGALDEPFWFAGFRSWIGRSQFEAFYGERFFGPSYWLTFERRMSKSDLVIRYRETQQTDESAALDGFAQDADADLNRIDDNSLTPDSSINRPGSGNRSLNKEARADYRATLYRSRVQLYAFWRERDQISAVLMPGQSPADATSTDESIGVGFDARWDIGARTEASIFGHFTDRRFDVQSGGTKTTSDLYNINGQIRIDIGFLTELSFLVGYQTQRSNSSQDFDEYNAAVRLRRYFLRR